MAFDLDAARKSGYSDAEIAAHLAQRWNFDIGKAKGSGYTDGEVIAHLMQKTAALAPSAAIPGQEGEAARVAAAQAQPQPGIAQQAVGAAEAGLTLATGATGGMVGMIGGTLKGLAEQILSGQFGTQQAAQLVEQAAQQGAAALTYAPRTEAGQEMAASVGGALQNLIPLAGVAGEVGALARGAGAGRGTPAGALARAGVEGTARDVANLAAKPVEALAPGAVAPRLAGELAAKGAGAAVGAVRSAAERAGALARTATTMPRRALEAIRKPQEAAAPTPGTMGSVGAAGTDAAAQRIATASDLPYPLSLTRGQATRNAAQLNFEVETAKLPEQGAPLRQRMVEQNNAILNNFDAWIDQTGARAPTLRAVGNAVDEALVKQAAADKAQIRAAYKAAERAGEMESPVSLGSVIQHINESGPEAATAPLLSVARQKAMQVGIAEQGPDGVLVARPVPLKIAEQFRQAVSQATDYAPTNIRQSTILKGLVDEATAGAGGAVYRQARALRARYAQNYEDRAVIAKLLNNKRGTSDRQVALEDVFDHAVLKGSLDDVRNVRRVLHRSGEQGQQAWRELQGATATWLRDEATKTVATDSAGRRVVSPAALDKSIRALDADGRLEFVFGKKGAQQMRDLRDLAQYVKTVPPEAAINTSNNLTALLAAFADVTFSGMSGMPAPITTVTRMAARSIKDRSLRRRIEDALNNPAKQAPARTDNPPQQAPSRSTVH